MTGPCPQCGRGAGPRLARGESRQDYGTPRDFLDAVIERFGNLETDLAASAHNRKAPLWIDEAHDSLRLRWPGTARNWLNPPFAKIGPWAAKCAETKLTGEGRIFFLVPASIGSAWFSRHVNGRALVLSLTPRLTFAGCADPYPKDCILAVYGERPGFEVWRWKS